MCFGVPFGSVVMWIKSGRDVNYDRWATAGLRVFSCIEVEDVGRRKQ